MIRVAIADDHALFADGMRNAFDLQPDMRVVVVAHTGPELLEALAGQPADVALVDLEMPGGGLETIGLLPEGTRALLVTMHGGSELSGRAEVAGASGVLSKSAPLSDLTAAVRACMAGERVPDDPEVRSALLDHHRQPRLDPGAESLTDREVELLRLLATGVTATDELAESLFISQKTVKNHLASIFQKLSVSDRTQAAIEAIKLGLANPR